MAHETVTVRFEYLPCGGVQTVVEAPGAQTGRGDVGLSREESQRILEATESMAWPVSPTPTGGSRLREIGSELFEGLFSADAERVFREVRGRSGPLTLHLLFRLDEMDWLAHLPWELLHEPGGSEFLFLDPQVHLVRTVELADPPAPLLEALPLHVLVASASPVGTIPLDFAEELRGIESAGGRRRLTVEHLEHATLEGLLARLSPAGRATGPARPSILHFIGHGGINRDRGVPGLDLEDLDGQRHFVAADELATSLRNSGIRLVVLNACDTGQLPKGQPFEGVAIRLLRSGIPAVVAMQRPILDSAAIEFGRSFYSQLVATGRIDRALTQARRVLWERERDSATWVVPVLYQRGTDPLFPLPGPLPEIVRPGLERRRSRFFHSIEAHLAGGQLIQRRETQEVLARLSEETTQVVVIHGVAGSGKSGVLYELAHILAAQGRPILPLRLDRDHLQENAQRLGEALGLPDSPAACLAAVSRESGGILLIDQLDAIRWTSAHSVDALEICREMIDEALADPAGLKVVVCCRTFDLDHDPQLGGWEKQTQKLVRVEVQQLSPDDVDAALKRAITDRPEVMLRPKQRELLRHILHLQMWLAIYQTTQSAPEFDSTWSLMERFWSTLRDGLIHDRVDRAAIERFEHRFVEALQLGAVLSAPTHCLKMSDLELKLYQDHHLIQVDGGRFTFCHQSYQDYLVAEHLSRELDACGSEQGQARILTWLGGREKQTLFRREQLRLLLGALRGQGHEAYLPILELFLPTAPPETESVIRFHLRLLALQFLGQVTDPRPEEITFVLRMLDKPYWREHVLAEVIRGQVAWFEALDEHRIFETWLAGNDPRLRDSVLEVLLYAVEKSGDRTARLLEPYMERDEEWTRRIVWVLHVEPAEDSDDLFELRIRLTEKGAFIGDHVDWRKLAKKPDRFIRLLFHLLAAYAADIIQEKHRSRAGRLTEIDWYTLENLELTEFPREYRNVAWEVLFKAVGFLVRLKAYPEEADHILKSHKVDFATLKPVLRVLSELGRAWLAEDWPSFVSVGGELSQSHRRTEVVFLENLVEGPVEPAFADWTLHWLMADPWRVRLCRSRGLLWALSGRLVEKFAPICTAETYNLTEEWLLSYREPDFSKYYKRRHERISRDGDLRAPSLSGETTYALLAKLPITRRSAAAKDRLLELGRKFRFRVPAPDEAEDDISAGWVGSPLAEGAKERLSDESWLAIATNSKLSKQRGRLRFKRGGQIEESTPENFATNFRTMAQKQPDRFATLALRLPPETNPIFLLSIVGGLCWPGDHAKIERWKPPSVVNLESVIALPTFQRLVRDNAHAGAAMDFCHLLERYSQYHWSDSAINLLGWIARNHIHPCKGYYPVHSNRTEDSDFDLLEDNALNSTRGAAGLAIRSLLFTQPQSFSSLQPALRSLTQDEHPAVRVAAMAACLPVINIDRALAVELFLQACEGQEAALSSHWAREFLRYATWTHLEQLQSVLERMIVSSISKVACAGASQVAVCYFCQGKLAEEFERCIGGTPRQRQGVAEVAAFLLEKAEFADKAKAALLHLADDEDPQVARKVSQSFRQLNLKHVTSDPEIWNRLARSKAFQHDPSPLLYALRQQTADLLPFAECLFMVGATFAEELAEASRNSATSISGDARNLVPLMLRLYDQTKGRAPKLHQRCLDLWDRLLERRVGAAMGLTRELDRL